MKHRVAGRKLGRTSAHRLALLRNLSASLFEKERITTTLGKAKELRPVAEKLVTLSKRETLHARRQVLRHIHNRKLAAKLFDTLSARFAQRPGGYLRIIKLGPRRGDNAEMAVVELIGSEPTFAKPKKGAAGGKAKAAKGASAAETPAEDKAKARKVRAKAKTKDKPRARKADGKGTETDKDDAAPSKRRSARKKVSAETSEADKGRKRSGGTSAKARGKAGKE